MDLRPDRSDLQHTFRSMASDVRFWVVRPRAGAEAAVAKAERTVLAVASTCTRFDPTSDLMRANAAGTQWQQVAPECFEALVLAAEAHRLTDGLFDPRVLTVLTSIGYDRSLPFAQRTLAMPDHDLPKARRRWQPVRRWKPAFDEEQSSVRIGPEPVDLGGIGKGLAVTWASEILAGSGDAVLAEAGGDLMALGGGPDGTGWMVNRWI